MKHSMKLLLAAIPLGFLALCFLAAEALIIFHNGGVCNYSSIDIWLTVTESSGRKAYPLRPGSCSDADTQDVEAIWGRDCNTDPCGYQAWKLGAGRFEVYDDGESPAGFVLQVRGWGVGSRWRIAPAWPKPELSTLGYSLMR
jgi:hypothetical protein